jgi:hypothetical protein
VLAHSSAFPPTFFEECRYEYRHGRLDAGYGVFTADGNFIAFDQAGNRKAEQALKGSKRKDKVKVRLPGDKSGSAITVTAIKVL